MKPYEVRDTIKDDDFADARYCHMIDLYKITNELYEFSKNNEHAMDFARESYNKGKSDGILLVLELFKKIAPEIEGDKENEI